MTIAIASVMDGEANLGEIDNPFEEEAAGLTVDVAFLMHLIHYRGAAHQQKMSDVGLNLGYSCPSAYQDFSMST